MTKIEKLKELEAKATPGPWRQHLIDDTCVIDAQGEPICNTWPEGGEDADIDFSSDTEQRERDAALIVAMRNALPALLDLASKAPATLSLAGEDAGGLLQALDAANYSLTDKAAALIRSLTLRVEAEKRAKEEATEDTRSLCRFILSEWGPDGALKATTYSLEQREARSAKGGDANDSGPSRPIDATSPGVTAGASTGWQPIETAPKDGTPILCFVPDPERMFSAQSGIDVLWFDEGAWLYNAEPVVFQPTHWMPLPAAPVDGGKDA